MIASQRVGSDTYWFAGSGVGSARRYHVYVTLGTRSDERMSDSMARSHRIATFRTSRGAENAMYRIARKASV